MVTPESKILSEIRLGIPSSTRLFRQTVGKFWTQQGAPVYVGMKGTPDLVGYTMVKITPAMVGRTVAVYTCLEVKNERGIVAEHQRMFLDAIKKAGGIAGVARSVEDAHKIIGEIK